MKAPSERHLEDYIWEHPEALGTINLPPEYGEDCAMYSFVLRQFHLPSGIVDLIGFDYRMVIFELKKNVVTAQALTQLMRYMRDLQRIVDRLLMTLMESQVTEPWARLHFDVNRIGPNPLLAGTLIGHDIEDDNLLIACQACNVDVYLYEYENGVYTFEDISLNTIMGMDVYDSVCRLAAGEIGKAFFDHFRQDIEDHPARDVQVQRAMFSVLKAAEAHLKERDEITGGAV